jgi:hypothetical protein
MRGCASATGAGAGDTGGVAALDWEGSSPRPHEDRSNKAKVKVKAEVKVENKPARVLSIPVVSVDSP